MPLLFIAQTVFGLISLIVLGGSGYLLWSWWSGEVVVLAGDEVERLRQDWRLWLGLGLLAWSFLGRWVTVGLLAGHDVRPSRPVRAEGRQAPAGQTSNLYVEQAGQAGATSTILTHGWGMDSTIWAYARKDLGPRLSLTLWDLPGLGRSQPARDISLEAMAAELRGLLAVAGPEKVLLVGHSIGGMIIQTLARDAPEVVRDRVAGVVLLNTTYTNPLRTMVLSRLALALQKPVIEPMLRLTILLHPLAWLAAWQSYLSGMAHLANRLGFDGHVTRSQLEHTTLLATRNPPAAQARGILAMLRWDATDALRELDIPVLVIAGDKDIVTRAEAGRAIAASAPRGALEVVKDANHMGMLELAELYNGIIADFAATAASSAHRDAGLRPPA